MPKKLKVGIIGIGGIGVAHADAYLANNKDAELVAFCDTNLKRLNSQAEKFEVKERFSDYSDLLKTDVDAVSICVTNSLHREVAISALNAGKHVLLEKPMAMNANEADEIVSVAEKKGKTLQIAMVWRQKIEAQLVRRFVDEGIFGKVYHIRAVLIRRRGIPGLGGWFTTKALSGGGPLIDLGVHIFDVAMFMSGLWHTSSVSAMTYAKFGPRMRDYKYVGMWAGPPNYNGVFDVEDYATGFVRFEGGATMTFETAWASNAENEIFIEILGDKAGIRVFDEKPFKILTEHQGQIADISPKFSEQENSYHIQARKFISACKGESPPAATGKEGFIVMKLIDAIYTSSSMGKEVKIKL